MSRLPHGMSRYDLLQKHRVKEHDTVEENPARQKPFKRTFGRLKHPANPVQTHVLTDQDVIDTLHKLGLDMASTKDKSGVAPAGMTFFGQFVDHDITLDATSALGRRIVPETIPNDRTPALDLDCVYGSGPEATPHLYGADKTSKGGTNTANMLLYGNGTNPFDLARTSNDTALIGDPRNDENAIISQIQANFVALHNILMTMCLQDQSTRDEVQHCAHMGMSANDWHQNVPSRNEVFEEVRRFIRLHYQYVVWEEFLPGFVDQSCLDDARNRDIFGPKAPIMPAEFSVAAYRFGHSTAQPDYRLRKGETQTDLSEILGFGIRGQSIDMTEFFDIDGIHAQKARPVGITLGKAMTELPFIMEEMELPEIGAHLSKAQSRNLPLRNMIRDRYTFQLQSGEALAKWMRNELGLHAPEVKIHKTLKAKGITKTPLWFYCLQEAADHGNGKLLGVGGAIVASVFAKLLREDQTTYWNAMGFTPSKAFANAGGVFAGMMKFAEKHRKDGIMHAEDLKNGG